MTALREAILAATLTVVADRGYADAGALEIIAAARISSKTFYRHFQSKESAFRTALHQEAETILQATVASASAAETWPERVRASLATLLTHLTDRPTLARMTFIDLQAAGPDAVGDLQRWLEIYAESLTPKTTERGYQRPQRPGVLTQVAGGITQTLYDAIRSQETDDLKLLLPDLLMIVMRPYLGPRQSEQLLHQPAR